MANLHLGGLKCDTIRLGSRGTPQGSVLSSFLFNIVMANLPSKLNHIPDLKHSIYADDITLWVNQSNDAHIEETLQTAVTTVEDYVRTRGLACSPEKSELLLLRGLQGKNKVQSHQSKILVRANGHPIPEVSKLIILGLPIQNTGRNSETLGKLESAALQTLRLIMRISNKHAGMKKVHLHWLVQTFVLSRVTYTVLYLRLTSAEKARVETLLRKVYKVATGLPTRTSTASYSP